MVHKDYDLINMARARHFFEEECFHEHVFTYHNLEWFGKLRNDTDKDVKLSTEYINDTEKLVEDMLSRFTTLTLTYDDDSTFWEVNDLVQGWVHFDILEIDKVERRFVLEGEKEVLERVKDYLEEIVRGWEKDSLEETNRLPEKKGIDLKLI